MERIIQMQQRYKIPQAVIQLKAQFATDMNNQNSELTSCPRCHSSLFVGNGTTKIGTPRYRCRSCGKSFVLHTSKADDTSRKSIAVWDMFVDCMLDRMSYRMAAKVCGIGRNTAFRWRHQLFDSLVTLYQTGKIALPSPEELLSDDVDLYKEDDIEGLDFGLEKEPMYDGSELEQATFTETQRTPKDQIRVVVNGWNGVYLKNVNKYRLWEHFAKEAMASGYEKKYIGTRILKNHR